VGPPQGGEGRDKRRPGRETLRPHHKSEAGRRREGARNRREGRFGEETQKQLRMGARSRPKPTPDDERNKPAGPEGGSQLQAPQRRQGRRPPRPALPESRSQLAEDVYRELRETTRSNELADVARAFAAAGDALEEGDIDRATELLTWAKSVAVRSAVIREALGVARYLAGDFAGANRELLAYRRLSGRQDQNHLLADCARAAGQSEKVAEYVDEMTRAGAPLDRVAEGLLVLAGERADRGDLRGSLSTLKRAELNPDRVQPWHPRLWYFAGDLHERLGDLDQARDYFEAITAVEEDFLDTKDRLAALSMHRQCGRRFG
jgi:tetratricopeptide (TPR) repeat protein